MLDIKLRLINMLGLLTIIVVGGLVLDYLNIARRPLRLGLIIAVIGVSLGIGLVINAVLPDSHLYGTVFSESKTRQKMVALTFDDGPYPPYTDQILDILDQYNIPATFFIVGKNAEKHPDIVRRIAQKHQIGNHTYNHVDLLKANRTIIADEIDKTSGIIRDITGQQPRIVRPPHGFRDAAVMGMMYDRGLTVVEWSVASRDWTNPGVNEIVKRTMGKVRNGSIILLHDGDGIAQTDSRAQTVEATRRIIEQLTAEGYRFVKVDEIVKRAEDNKQ